MPDTTIHFSCNADVQVSTDDTQMITVIPRIGVDHMQLTMTAAQALAFADALRAAAQAKSADRFGPAWA